MMKIFTFFFLSAAIFFILPQDLSAQVNVNDSLALVDFYNSTDGPHWKSDNNWLFSNPVSKWKGVTVTNNRVVGLSLSKNGMHGKLPASIGNMDQLTFIDISYNSHLHGPIPHEIGNLTNLITLKFYKTGLNGFLPHEMGNLVNLKYLTLELCNFQGKIPNTFKNLTSLVQLYLYKSNLGGQIPAFFQEYKNLYDLDLSYNNFSGSIPHELGNLPNIESLFLNNNNLSGSIPASIGRLKTLYGLYLNNNKLSGPIPSTFKKLKAKSTTLHIENNFFTFAGLEDITRPLYTFYSPQGKVPLYQSGNKIWVSVGGTPSNDTYYWYRNGILIDSTNADSSFIVTEGGTYNVRAKNAVAKALTLYSEKVHIDIDSDFIVSNIKSEKKTFASVFPNPVKTNTALSFSASGKYTINIVDMNGKTLQTITGVSNKTQNVVSINLSHYSSGVYNAVITDEKNEKRVLKILKE